MTCEDTRQIIVATTNSALSRPKAAHQSSPQKTAPSLIRTATRAERRVCPRNAASAAFWVAASMVVFTG